MCQLLALSANTPTDIMFSFTGFATRSAEHQDGFGIAFFEDRGLRHFVDDRAASQSPIAELIRHYPIRSTNIIAHIRKATQGKVALENTHPFVRELWGRYWVFAHNGNVPGFQPRLHSHFQPVGETDSERAFCWILQELAKAHASLPSPQELTRTLSELMPQISEHGTFNCLLSQGQTLWAHASTDLHWLVRSHPFRKAQLRDEDLEINFAQLTTSNDRVAIVVTQPLTEGEDWQAFRPGELLTFMDGQPVF